MKRLARHGFLFLSVTLFMGAANALGQHGATANDQRQSAIALEQEGKNAEAEDAWRAVLKLHPASAEAYAHLGLLEARQEHYKQAVPLYRKALALNPEMPALRMNLGLSLFKSGALRESIQVFTPLLKSEPPSSLDARRLPPLIALAHFGVGEYAAAIPYFKKVTAQDPQNLPFRLALAQSCLWSQHYQCVLDVYHEILNLNADSAEADMLAGEAMDEMGNHGGAIEQFRAAVKADPKLPNVHFGLGYLLWSQNQLDEAAQEFQAELVNVPENAQALTYLADCDLRLNRPGNVRPLIEKSTKIDPSQERAYLDLGILDAGDGHPDDALREFKMAIRISPGDPDVHWRLARLYQSMGRKAEAKIEFDKTSSLHKAEKDSLAVKLKAAQDKGKPAEDSQPGSPVN